MQMEVFCLMCRILACIWGVSGAFYVGCSDAALHSATRSVSSREQVGNERKQV